MESLQKYKTPLYQTSVFCITAGLYSMLHASRTAWAYAKPTLVDEHDYTNSFLSVLDFSFLCAYAGGLFVSGWLGDRLKLKTLLGQGMLLTVFALMNFALIAGLLRVKSLLIGIPLFGLLGLAQSSGFPTCIAILSNWFHVGQRGLIFGAWMTNINVGNIFGQQLGKIFLDILHYPWPYLLLLCAGIIFVMVLIMLRYLYVTPADAGITLTVEPEPEVEAEAEPEPQIQSIAIRPPSPEVSEVETAPTTTDLSKPRAIGFWEAWKIPGVLLYAIVYICTKATVSALLFWLPTYLKQEIGFEDETADLLAFLEIGQLIGVIGLGWISDKVNKAAVIASSLFGATVIFFILNFIKSPDEKSTLMALLFIGGFLIGGPAGLIVGAVSSEIGDKKGKGGENSEKVKATSTITGIIDGSGTVGAAIVQPIVPLCRSHCFLLYAGLLLVATVLTPLAQRQASKHAAKGMAAADQNNPEVEVKELQVCVKDI